MNATLFYGGNTDDEEWGMGLNIFSLTFVYISAVLKKNHLFSFFTFKTEYLDILCGFQLIN